MGNKKCACCKEKEVYVPQATYCWMCGLFIGQLQKKHYNRIQKVKEEIRSLKKWIEELLKKKGG